MSIQTLEDLNKTLATDIAWRKKELSEIKTLIELKNVSLQRHNVCIRSGICILYAHWEGFVKLAGNSYVEYIRTQRLRYGQLSSNFLALAMKEKLKQAKETNKASLYIPVCDFFLFQLDERCSLPKNPISTASNLSSEILKEITHTLGIDFFLDSTKSKLIDEKLLKTRNEIAHGEDSLTIDRKQYMELQTMIMEVLEEFRNRIENAAINQDFLLKSQ
ncbi:MAG: MAE_28990/MAE_18760 family HEPN-like nuclease [Dolichospermum sp.]